MTITREGRHMGPCHFGLFLVSLDSTYRQNISSKGGNHFGRFPRKFIYQSECELYHTFAKDQYVHVIADHRFYSSRLLLLINKSLPKY